MDAPTPPPIPTAPVAPEAPVAPVAATASAAYGTTPYGTAAYNAPPAYGTAPYGTAPYATPPASGIAPYSAPPAWAPPAAPQNVLAWVAFGLGIGSLMFGLLASIPAIILGHIARRQIRTRGEQGAAAALIGLIFGYALSGLVIIGLALYIAFIVLIVGTAATTSGSSTF